MKVSVMTSTQAPTEWRWSSDQMSIAVIATIQ